MIPDCIHAFVLFDEFNELLDSQTELKTALPNKETKDRIRVKPLHAAMTSAYSGNTTASNR